MPRIVGVDVPKDKRIEIALTYIFGIGRKTAGDILKEAGVAPETRGKDLTEEEVGKIAAVIQKGYRVEGDLNHRRCNNVSIGYRVAVYVHEFRLKREHPIFLYLYRFFVHRWLKTRTCSQLRITDLHGCACQVARAIHNMCRIWIFSPHTF